MKLLITVVVVAAVLCVGFASSTNLSTSEMDATWGGGNCKMCPQNTNADCGQTSCTFYLGSTSCKETSGGSYKVCADGTHKDQECYNDDSVSCGTRDYCDDGEGHCDKDNYDCSCHSEAKTMAGCA
ncbi:MAG: hypothetical protein ACYS32_02690 [Planctomycetota bacterium]